MNLICLDKLKIKNKCLLSVRRHMMLYSDTPTIFFLHRSTTVYLADRRFDMLPEVLSADLCSLIGGVDR